MNVNLFNLPEDERAEMVAFQRQRDRRVPLPSSWGPSG
jgi:hypothetical protein